MPAKIILVPGTTPRGSWMYSLNFASPQTMPEFLLASEYSKPSTLPEWRPSSPFSTGPILFSASSPMEWQGRHLWNEISPLATSWAHPALAEATIKPAATISDFIGNSLLIPWRIHALCLAGTTLPVQAARMERVNGQNRQSAAPSGATGLFPL